MNVFKTVPECGEEYKGQKRLNSEPNISERSGTDACQSLPLAAGLGPINPSTDGPRGWVSADEWTRSSTSSISTSEAPIELENGRKKSQEQHATEVTTIYSRG